MKNFVTILVLGAIASTCMTSAVAAPATTDRVGIKECDDYIDQYQLCLNDKVPKEARDSLAASLNQMRTSWKAAASTPSVKASLAQTCTQARQAAKASLAAYGCSGL